MRVARKVAGTRSVPAAFKSVSNESPGQVPRVSSRGQHPTCRDAWSCQTGAASNCPVESGSFSAAADAGTRPNRSWWSRPSPSPDECEPGPPGTRRSVRWPKDIREVPSADCRAHGQLCGGFRSPRLRSARGDRVTALALILSRCGRVLGLSQRVRYNIGMSSPTIMPPQPPKVYRAMKRDPADNLPVVGSTSSSELGVRSGVDITVDAAGSVVLDASGMSVAPRWRDLDFTRIPRRLRHIVPGATGANSTSCFTMGVGPFQHGAIANALELIPDEGQSPVTHGVVAPVQVVALAQYQTDLENTRAEWQIDET